MESTKRKVLQIIGVCLLGTILIVGSVIGVLLGLSVDRSNVLLQIANEDRMIISDFEENGICLTTSEAVTSSDGTTSQILRASVSPNIVIDSTLYWIVSWEDPDSSFASGKNVESYISLVQSEDTLSAVVSCLNAFGEPIEITVASNFNFSLQATCKVHFQKRPTEAKVELKDISTGNKCSTIDFSDTGAEYFVQLSALSETVGTISSTYTWGESTYSFTDDFKSALNIIDSVGSFEVWGSSRSLNAPFSTVFPTVLDVTEADGEYYIYRFDLGIMRVKNDDNLTSNFDRILGLVKRAIYYYSGNILKVNAYSTNQKTYEFSSVVYVPKGVSNFDSLAVTNVSLDSNTINF